MSRTDKIQTLEQLENHINDTAVKKGVNSRFGTFTDMYWSGASKAAIAKTFKVSYRTMFYNWVPTYERITGKSRESAHRQTA